MSTTITFDDLSGQAFHSSGFPVVPNGYSGLQWNGFDVDDVANNQFASGASVADVSPPNVIFDANGQGAGFIFSSGTFNLDSFYLTSMWNDGLQVEVQGLLNNNIVYDVTLTADTSAPNLETLDWTGINAVNFAPGGGTRHSGFLGSGTEFDIDNLTIDFPCFCRGTMILTQRGEVPVERLKIGDLVTSLSGRAQPIAWIGSGRSLVTAINDGSRPIVVRAGALADGVPRRDLHVTAGHALYVDGVLIPAELLVNGHSIIRDERARVVEFFHVELPSHDVLIADGAPAESYKEDGNRALFHNGDRPLVAARGVEWCAPVLRGGAELERIWRRLLLRSGFTRPAVTADPDLHLVADGRRIDAVEVEDRTYRFHLGEPLCELRIASRSAVPRATGHNPDRRRLGVAIRSMSLQGSGAIIALSHDSPLLRDGFHEAEDELRWTDGDAVVPSQALLAFPGGFELVLRLGDGIAYPVLRADIAAQHAAA
ncbi:MAG: Hint domain-containing protein [Alphaproteobacteria bacterium]|nr:Hint domain-containing protein [Alphaproteobacteria bacterium]